MSIFSLFSKQPIHKENPQLSISRTQKKVSLSKKKNQHTHKSTNKYLLGVNHEGVEAVLGGSKTMPFSSAQGLDSFAIVCSFSIATKQWKKEEFYSERFKLWFYE